MGDKATFGDQTFLKFEERLRNICASCVLLRARAKELVG